MLAPPKDPVSNSVRVSPVGVPMETENRCIKLKHQSTDDEDIGSHGLFLVSVAFLFFVVIKAIQILKMPTTLNSECVPWRVLRDSERIYIVSAVVYLHCFIARDL